jgi:hypothetical protein
MLIRKKRINKLENFFDKKCQGYYFSYNRKVWRTYTQKHAHNHDVCGTDSEWVLMIIVYILLFRGGGGEGGGGV